VVTKKRSRNTMTRVNITTDYKWGTNLEQEAIDLFEKNAPDGKWLPFTKLGKFSHFDFCAVDTKRTGKLAFVEVKSRRCERNAYSDTIMPSVKMQKALELINLKNKAYLILNFTDEVCFVDLKDARMSFGYNARTDRGSLELGHYAFIPLDQFKTLLKKEKNDNKRSKTD